MLDAFFGSTGYHMNVNVLNRETLLDAMDHPEKYPSLTIRVSGYAVNFVRLTREQQMDVINRTFHGGGRMPEHAAPTRPLEATARSSFASTGTDVPDRTSATALATGDMGFLHSFTTGSTVDGPGVRVVAWTAGCMWRCLYCHNPDTWTMTNGIPVTRDAGRRGTAEVPSRPEDHVRRIHAERRRAADAAPVRREASSPPRRRWESTRRWIPTASTATG